MFVLAYNRLMADRENLIEDCKSMRQLLEETSELDAKIKRLTEETAFIAGLVEEAVKKNAATPQSQEAYNRERAALVERYEKASQELERLIQERDRRKKAGSNIARFIRELRWRPDILGEWDNTIWTVMVEKAIVHRDGSITFLFYNGTEIRIEA